MMTKLRPDNSSLLKITIIIIIIIIIIYCNWVVTRWQWFHVRAYVGS